MAAPHIYKPHYMSKRIAIATLIVVASLSHVKPREAEAQNGQPLKYTGKATTAAITAEDAKTRLYIFADDSMMGRRAGEVGGLKGTAYIEREVRRIGLVPAGDNGTFFQAVPLYDRLLDTSSKLSADAEALVSWLLDMPRPPETVYVVHGEPEAAEALAGGVRAKMECAVAVARLDERVLLD